MKAHIDSERDMIIRKKVANEIFDHCAAKGIHPIPDVHSAMVLLREWQDTEMTPEGYDDETMGIFAGMEYIREGARFIFAGENGAQHIAVRSTHKPAMQIRFAFGEPITAEDRLIAAQLPHATRHATVVADTHVRISSIDKEETDAHTPKESIETPVPVDAVESDESEEVPDILVAKTQIAAPIHENVEKTGQNVPQVPEAKATAEATVAETHVPETNAVVLPVGETREDLEKFLDLLSADIREACGKVLDLYLAMPEAKVLREKAIAVLYRQLKAIPNAGNTLAAYLHVTVRKMQKWEAALEPVSVPAEKITEPREKIATKPALQKPAVAIAPHATNGHAISTKHIKGGKPSAILSNRIEGIPDADTDEGNAQIDSNISHEAETVPDLFTIEKFPYLAPVRGADIHTCVDYLNSMEIPEPQPGVELSFSVSEKKLLLALLAVLKRHGAEKDFLDYFGIDGQKIPAWKKEVAAAEKKGEVKMGSEKKKRKKQPADVCIEMPMQPKVITSVSAPVAADSPEREKWKKIIDGVRARTGDKKALDEWRAEHNAEIKDVIRWMGVFDAEEKTLAAKATAPQKSERKPRVFTPFVTEKDHEDCIKAMLPILLEPFETHEWEDDDVTEKDEEVSTVADITAKALMKEGKSFVPSAKRSHAFRSGFGKMMNPLSARDMQRLKEIMNSTGDKENFEEWYRLLKIRFGMNYSDAARTLCSELLRQIQVGGDTQNLVKAAMEAFPALGAITATASGTRA